MRARDLAAMATGPVVGAPPRGACDQGRRSIRGRVAGKSGCRVSGWGGLGSSSFADLTASIDGGRLSGLADPCVAAESRMSRTVRS